MRTNFVGFLLATALPGLSAPALAQVEVGENDFQISGFFEQDVLPAPPTAAGRPAVAYNSTDDEFLVVWPSRAVRDSQVCDLFPIIHPEEIKGQRYDASTGAPIGDTVRISSSCREDLDVAAPDVAYNGITNQYLVVWQAQAVIVDPVIEREILGQVLSADLTKIGGEAIRISDMGEPGNPLFEAFSPAVVHNRTDNEYLVVWSGDDNTGPLVEGELEIFGQLLGADGAEVDPNDFRISEMAGSGVPFFMLDGVLPAVTYNSVENEFLVVWQGSSAGELVVGEYEIFGQLVDASGGEQGDNDFRISDMGSSYDPSTKSAFAPAATYNSVDNEYLVVWHGNDSSPSVVLPNLDVYGQFLDASGEELGVDDFRISGAEVAAALPVGTEPAVEYNPNENEYFVTWQADNIEGEPGIRDIEIFGQRVDSNGVEQGADDLRLSDMSGDGASSFEARVPAVAFAESSHQIFVVWQGDDDENGGVDDEFQVFGQRLVIPLFVAGFESGDTSEWSQ